MFIKEHGTAAILLAAIFLALGFMLGKVTGKGHHGCNKGYHKSSCNHGKQSSNSDFVFHSDDHMIIVESMMSEGFEGDTILKIPGGEIHMSIDGDYVNVRVDVDEEDLHERGEHGERGEHKEVKVVKVITVDQD